MAARLVQGHQHEDKLSLLLYADGAYTLTEANRYAYDTSEMRRYVLSTRGHNTVRVDGQDQNRRKTYAWKKEDIARKSDLDYTLSPDCDRVSAIYDEGYGDGQDRDVTHSRRVLFLKQPGHGLRPFVIVVDRLTAKEQSHQYEWLWHLDSPTLKADGLKLQAGTLHVLVPDVPDGNGIAGRGARPDIPGMAGLGVQFGHSDGLPPRVYGAVQAGGAECALGNRVVSRRRGSMPDCSYRSVARLCRKDRHAPPEKRRNLDDFRISCLAAERVIQTEWFSTIFRGGVKGKVFPFHPA